MFTPEAHYADKTSPKSMFYAMKHMAVVLIHLPLGSVWSCCLYTYANTSLKTALCAEL